MTMQWNLYAALYLAAGLICLLVAWLCWQRRAIPGARTLAWLMLAIGEWACVGALEMAATTIPLKVFWTQVSYLGTATSPVFLLLFTFDYNRSQWLTRRNVIALLIVPAIIIALAATNEWHHLIWTSFSFGSSQDNILDYSHGIGFWILVIYSYLAIVAGIVNLVRAWRRFQEPYRRQAFMLLLGFLLPCAWNIVYVFELSPIPNLDATPIAFAITGWILVVTILRYRLLDLVPVARDILIEKMNDGVLVFDLQNRLVDVNPRARALLGENATVLGQALRESTPVIASHLSDTDHRSEIFFDQTQQWLEMRVSPLRDPQARVTGRLVVLHDISDRKNLEATMAQMNTQLEHLVAERTDELQATIRELQHEITERKHAEEKLRGMEQALSQRVALQSRKLAALYEVILFAGRALTVEEMQSQVLEMIMNTLGAQAGCVHELNAKTNQLRLAVQRGLSAEQQSQIKTLPAPWLIDDSIPRAVINLGTEENIPSEIRLPGLIAYLGVPTFLQNKPTGALGAFWNHPRSFSVEDIALFSALADQLGIIIENARLREKSEAAAVQQERRRLGRDLHDSVTQSLHSLVLSADTAHNRLKQARYDRLDASLMQLAESARQALKEMRLLLYELRLRDLTHVNLIEAVQLRLDSVEKRAGMDAALIVDPAIHIPKAWEGELYCVVMEALNNSLKHARANKIQVELKELTHGIDLQITDNGQGIDPHARKPGGMGLTSMAERAERLGGKLSIDSAPNQGTRIHLCVEPAQGSR